MSFLSNFDVPMTVGFFLIITGALTWLAIAIAGFWLVIDALERLVNRAIYGRPEPVRIYRHR